MQTSKKKLIIFPFSGTAIEALDCIGDEFECVAFVSDDESKINSYYFKIPIIDRLSLSGFEDCLFLSVPGSDKNFKNRQTIIDNIYNENLKYTVVKHPTASVSQFATLGKNVLIMAGVSIGPNVILGDHVVVLPNSTIHHDSVVGNYTLICGNVLIAGNTNIGNNCYLGAGSSIRNGISIGAKSLVGLGATVLNNIPEQETWVGNPAKKLNEKI